MIHQNKTASISCMPMWCGASPAHPRHVKNASTEEEDAHSLPPPNNNADPSSRSYICWSSIDDSERNWEIDEDAETTIPEDYTMCLEPREEAECEGEDHKEEIL